MRTRPIVRERPGTDVVVTGCAAELERDAFAAMGARVVSNDAKGRAESYGASAAAQLDEPVVAQTLVGVEHRVDVDAECVGEVPRGGQPLALRRVAGCDARRDRVGDLVVHRALVRVDRDEHQIILVHLALSVSRECLHTAAAPVPRTGSLYPETTFPRRNHERAAPARHSRRGP